MTPDVEISCVVCGHRVFETVCTAEEIEAQQEYLREFHCRRLRPSAPPEALADRAEFTQDYATNIVVCGDCGLLLRNPRPRSREITRAYMNDNYGQERLEALFKAQVELARPKAEKLAKRLGKGATVVEVGSHAGGFLAAGREQGWKMLGVDPGGEVADFCAGRGLPVFRGTLTEADIEPESADCIAIWNTFDQLPNPRPTLTAAERLLRPGGLFMVRVPNGACFRWAAEHCRSCHCNSSCTGVDALIQTAMAWNNMLAFPYLYGYSAKNLDLLMSCHSLRRLVVEGDTLLRLTDGETRLWAAMEEKAVKFGCRLAARLESCRSAHAPVLSPWLDVMYEKAAPVM